MYRAKPVTQRDGSKLQNSNCRMASISTGLDFHTVGAKTSTGGKMRSYTTDQTGGTDSGDAKQSWAKGYTEALTIRDGGTWAQALADLRAGHLINLDVWHEACQGPCLSGSGRYGHNMAIAPEKSGSRWLVSDPWCNPAKWQWWEEDLLRVGAEEWGRRLRAGTAGEGTFASRALYILALAATAKRLMTESTPDSETPPNHLGVTDPEGEATDTGGASTIMWTRTRSQNGGSNGGGGSDDVRFINMSSAAPSGWLINVGETTRWSWLDGKDGGDIPGKGAVEWVGKADSLTDDHIIRISIPQPYSDGKARPSGVLLHSTNDPYTAPVTPTPEPPPSTDCKAEVAAALTARDREWEEWLLAGSPAKG
jgi:hypothetical protein